MTGNGDGNGPTVRRLFVYPVKSAAGVAVDAVDVDDFGPRRDRRWLVVDDEGEAITQREAAGLALVRPSFEGDGLALDAPGMNRIRVPWPESGGGRRVRIWTSAVDAADAGDAAAGWLSEFLERRCRLVHFPDGAMRRPPPHRRVGPGRLSFVDAAPFLVLTEAAMDALNHRLPEPLGVDRFRPSIVVDGAEAHAEDRWDGVVIGGVRLRRVKPCARCVMTTIDQKTAVAGKEPLRTLARYRNKGGKVYFGQYFAHEAAGGRIRVGEAARVLDA